jgi:DNA-directed RNA polymerase specialized sigma24 family protein
MKRKAVLESYLYEFKKGFIDRSKLESLIFLHLKSHFRFYTNALMKADVPDFLSWFYPRLHAAVDKYEERGFSFDSYLGALMRCSAREYRRDGEGKRRIEASYWDCAAAGDAGSAFGYGESGPEYTVLAGEEQAGKAIIPDVNRRQALMLILKNYHAISDDFISRASAALRLGPGELQRLVNTLKSLRTKRDEELWRLRERLHSQYFRLMSYEYRLRSTGPDSRFYDTLRTRVERHRTRLENMRSRFKTMKKGATNQQVASVLGIPKGTVDSALHSLKRRWKNNDDSV